MLGLLKDVRRRQISTQKLPDIACDYRALISQSPMGIIIFLKGRVVFSNETAKKLLKVGNIQDLMGVDYRNLVDDAWHKPLKQYMDDVYRHSFGPMTDIRMVTAGGNTIEVQLTASVINFNDRRAIQIAFIDITKQKQTHEDLELQRNFLRSILDTSPNPIYVQHEDGMFVMANKATGNLFNLSPEDLMGTKESAVLPENGCLIVDEQTRKKIIEECLTEISHDMNYRDANGIMHSFQVIKTPITCDQSGRKDLLVICHDVTERIRAEKKLKQSEKLFSETVRNIQDYIFITDPSTKIIYLNPAAGYITGHDLSNAEGKLLNQVLKIQRTVEGKPETIPNEYLFGWNNPEKYCHWVQTSANKVYVSDFFVAELEDDFKKWGHIFVFRDITDRVNQEKIKAQIEKEKLAKLIEGQELERMRVSREIHDGLGQSLTAIKLNLKMLMKGGQIGSCIHELLRMIDEAIIETSRISENLIPSKLSEFTIQDSLKALCETMDLTNQISIFFRSTTQSEYTLSIEKKINLYRIAQEALNNAVKYSGATTIGINVEDSSDAFLMCIRDDGRGFDPVLVSRVKGKHGLRNMKDRCAIMNGDINIQSSPNEGTSITIKIPKLKDHG
jgi:PAS domain S-box-containing protein